MRFFFNKKVNESHRIFFQLDNYYKELQFLSMFPSFLNIYQLSQFL